MYFEFLRRFRIALVFVIPTISSFISKSLLGNTPVTMAILQSVWAPFHHELAQPNFWGVYI